MHSESITSKQVYLSRRQFIKVAGIIAGSLTLAGCLPPTEDHLQVTSPQPDQASGEVEQQDDLTSFEDVTGYTNYYEFTTDKEGVADLAKDFPTSPWEVEVYGLVNKPRTFTVDEMIRQFQPEERVYRLRCVEGWSMVIPWVGFPLSRLLNQVEPATSARYVRFESVYKPKEMPGQKSSWYPWPYQEGLRLDEAMNNLTILATGLYGGELPAQNGGGIRLVVPWKYGFKSIKAVIKIELVDQQPTTMWSAIAPDEYGFYANVNPDVDHPRWSQRTERRIGELSRRDTLMFNGYADQVAHLYEGMNLRENF